MKKRWIAMLLAVSMFLPSVSMFARAENDKNTGEDVVGEGGTLSSNNIDSTRNDDVSHVFNENLNGIEIQANQNDFIVENGVLIEYLGVDSDLVLPNNIISIGDEAFRNCETILNITIPDGVTSIGRMAFENCVNLENVILSNDITKIERFAFSGCKKLISIEIPDNVTVIEACLFSGCENLISVTIPKGVTTIEDGAFNNCSSLTTIEIPDGVTCIQDGAFGNCSSLKIIELPDGIINIPDRAFENCRKLTDIILPESVKNIGNYAFLGCSSLTTVKIPEGVTNIGDTAFAQCSALNEIVLPQNITSIKDGTFSGCTNLTNVTIPADVTSIGEYAFFYCSKLTEIVIPEGITKINTSTFEGCHSLESIIIPTNVTYIGYNAFAECNSLTSVIIPKNVIEIDACAFRSCSSLAEVILPESVTRIGWNAFVNCVSLKGISIPPNITTIEGGVFMECSSLKNVIIPEGVKNIQVGAFSLCDNLENIILPTSLSNIDHDVFPSGLQNIFYSGNEQQWTSIAGYNNIRDSVSIHYNVDASNISNGNTVKLLSNWAKDSNQVSFNNNIIYYITNKTTLKFDGSIDQFLNKYMLMKNDLFELTYLEPVDSKVGIMSDFTFAFNDGFDYLTSITVDGDTYPVAEKKYISMDSLKGSMILYHIADNEVVGIDLLQEKHGILEAWDGTNITIDGVSYPTNYMTDFSFLGGLDQKLGAEVNFYVSSDTDYKPLLKMAYYETKTGVFGSYDPISNMVFVDGQSYRVDIDKCKPDNTELNGKNVFFLIKDGQIIHIDKMDNLSSNLEMSLLPSEISFNYELGKFDSKESIVTVVVENNFNYTFPQGYDQSVILESEYLQGRVDAVALRDAKFETIDNLKFSKIEANDIRIPVGKSKTATVTVSLKDGYIPNNGSETLTSILTINAFWEKSNDPFELRSELVINIKNFDKESEDNNDSTDEEKQLEKEAADELKRLDSSIALNPDIMSRVFGIKGKNLDRFRKELFTEVIMSSAPKETFKETLTDKVFTKIFGKYKADVAGANYTVPLQYIINTPEYGKLVVQFNCNVTDYTLSETRFAFQANIKYEIIDEEMASKKVPDNLKSGFLGSIAFADVKSFSDAAYKLAEKELKKAYDEAWGKTANKAADIIFGDTVKSILKANDSSFKDEFWKLMIWPAKSIKNACPTDVYIYDQRGQLCGAIENNQIVKGSDDFGLSVDGDIKYITLLDDDYSIKYVATADGEMDVEVTEYISYEEPMRLVGFYDVPLCINGEYTQSIPQRMLPAVREYNLISEAGDIVLADTDRILLSWMKDNKNDQNDNMENKNDGVNIPNHESMEAGEKKQNDNKVSKENYSANKLQEREYVELQTQGALESRLDNSPATGDTLYAEVWIVLFVLSLVGIGLWGLYPRFNKSKG